MVNPVKTPLNHFELFNTATNGEPDKMLYLLASECNRLKALLKEQQTAPRPFETLALIRASRHMYATLRGISDRLIAEKAKQ